MSYFLTISAVVFRTQPYAFHLAHSVSWRGNYRVWREKYELALALSENDLALTSLCPTEPVDPMREENEIDANFTARQRDHAEVRMKYDLDRKKWDISNRRCLMVAKSTISDVIRGSIPDCDTATEYLKKVESQFTGSSKGLCKHPDQEVIQWEILWRRDKRAHIEDEQHDIQAQANGFGAQRWVIDLFGFCFFA